MFQKVQINHQFNILVKQLLLGALFLFLPILVQALGLGNARILSKLNEPLNIELEILANNPKELQNLLPNMADEQDFERAGIDKADYLTTAQFKVENQKGGSGKPIIRLTTIDPVKDPVVNVLIELTGSQGRILKEYTVLLDPREFSKNNLSEVKRQPQSAVRFDSSQPVFDAFEEKMPTLSTQPDQNQGLQLRMSKVEAQITELTNQKQNLEQAKLLLNEENNNLHDLVELKQKEIEMLSKQPVAIQSQVKQASLSDFAKVQMIKPDEIGLSDDASSFFSPWLLLGLILVMTLSAIVGLREWFKRKEMVFPFSFAVPKFSFGQKSEPEEEWQADAQKNKPQNFQEVVSLLQTSEEQQALHKPPISKPMSTVDKVDRSAQNPAAEQLNIRVLEDADVYITFGKVKMAEEIILKILNHQPDNIQARLKIMDLFLSQKRSVEAEEQFKLLPADFAKSHPDQYAKYLKKVTTENGIQSNIIHSENTAQAEVTPCEVINNRILEPSAELIDSFSATLNTPEANPISDTSMNKQDPSVFQTKLDFAKVYIDMKDSQSARDLLNEVIQSGPADLKEEAQALLKKLL